MAKHVVHLSCSHLKKKNHYTKFGDFRYFFCWWGRVQIPCQEVRMLVVLVLSSLYSIFRSSLTVALLKSGKSTFNKRSSYCIAIKQLKVSLYCIWFL